MSNIPVVILSSLSSSYIITDFEISFGVSLNLSVCFEANGACEKVIQVFNEHKLHKPFCNWTSDFAIKGKFLLPSKKIWIFLKMWSSIL